MTVLANITGELRGSMAVAHVEGEIDASNVVWVEERDTVRACHRLARSGFLFGGSTGTVVSGARAWLGRHDPRERLTALTLAPDLGERYLDTVYQANWVRELYGYDVLEDSASAPGSLVVRP